MANWVINLILRTGYGGLALLMIAECVFPPIPSEVIMPQIAQKSQRCDYHAAASRPKTLYWVEILDR